MQAFTSVALSTYNGDQFLSEQLESIFTQSPLPGEVVIGDDGSSDGTPGIIRTAARESPIPVTVVGGDHVGLRRNVQRTIDACAGRVIILCDQDDRWRPGRVAAIERAFADPDVTLWFSDAELIDQSGKALGRTAWQAVHLDDAARGEIASGHGLRRLLYGMTVTGATMAFRADVGAAALPLPAELDGDEHLFLHDGWIAVMAALLGAARLESRTLTEYRQHSRQLTAMSMATHPPDSAGTPGRRTRRETISREHARVELVLERLRATGLMDRCRQADAETLRRMERFLSGRLELRGWSRLAAVAGSTFSGDYWRYAAGLRSIAVDLLARDAE